MILIYLSYLRCIPYKICFCFSTTLNTDLHLKSNNTPYCCSDIFLYIPIHTHFFIDIDIYLNDDNLLSDQGHESCDNRSRFLYFFLLLMMMIDSIRQFLDHSIGEKKSRIDLLFDRMEGIRTRTK
jgi:hypothetical protein